MQNTYLFPDLWLEELVRYFQINSSVCCSFFFNDDIELFLEDVIKEPEGIKADLSSRCLTIYTHGALVRWQAVNSNRMNNEGYNF